MMKTEKLYELGYQFINNMGDYDLFVRKNTDSSYHDVYIRYHENINTKDREILVKKEDLLAIEDTIEVIENSEQYLDDEYQYINRLLGI